MATCAAPARRWRALSVSPSSIWKSWWACLTVATLRPRRVNSAIRRTTSVVLPDFFQPAMPMTGVLPARCLRSSFRGLRQHGAQLVQLLRRVGIEERIDVDAAHARRREIGTATVPCRSVQCRTLRTPPRSCSSRSSASATGHRPITGCSSPSDAPARWRPGRSRSPASSRCDQIGRQQRRVAWQPSRSSAPPAHCAADQRMPASTPASGPTNPRSVSATTGRPKARSARGSPLALMTTAPTCGAAGR